MKYLILTLIVIFSYTLAHSQQAADTAPVVPIATNVHPQRYEIVQSTLTARSTFKIDTYLGIVYVLVVDSNNVYSWQHVRRELGLYPDTWYPNSKNYSFFMSTTAVRYDYLMNVNTGTVWQYVIDPKTKELFFQPMDTN